MNTKRIIPCLDVDAGRVVKGVQFVSIRDAGDPAECARAYNEQGADELVFLDITASSDARPILLEAVRKTAEEVFLPLTVGGGVRTVENARELLRAGADKVSLNTAAVERPELIREVARAFGWVRIIRAATDLWTVGTGGGSGASIGASVVGALMRTSRSRRSADSRRFQSFRPSPHRQRECGR